MTKLSKSDALWRLQKAREDLSELLPPTNHFGYVEAVNEMSPEFEKWYRATKICIANVFPDSSDHVEEFEEIFHEKYGLYETLQSAPYAFNFSQNYSKALKSADTLLESMMEEVEEYWSDSSHQPSNSQQTNEPPQSKEVFVIHGKDENIKNEVKILLAEVGLEPVILAEQASKGLTIIEKFERHADVAFAVALLTPDDRGSESSETEQMFRARQNVVFELGFFLGKLGRERVCALTKGTVEIPSDYSGVVYIDLAQSDWKYELVRELRKAGLDADANKIQ